MSRFANMSIDNNHNKIWLRCVRERAFDCGECERERVQCAWMDVYVSFVRETRIEC